MPITINARQPRWAISAKTASNCDANIAPIASPTDAQRNAGAIVRDEGTQPDGHRAAERHGNERQARHEPRNNQHADYPAPKKALGLPDTRFARHRQLANGMKRAFAVPLAAVEPDQVAEHTADHSGTQYRREMQQR
ncbi:hypothetical protein [Paraburkholderia piptadeniae]|uniref:hypothetical protein n=1 Tax=Paraburkholderia piptadeniae TaxID=1701573 RepID=UPI003F6A28C6